MTRINTVEELETAMHDRRAVVIPGTIWEKPKPAAFILHLPALVLLSLLKRGIYLYERTEEKTLDFYHVQAYEKEIVASIIDDLLEGKYNEAYEKLGALKQVET